MLDRPCLELTELDFYLADSSKKTYVDGKPRMTEVPVAAIMPCNPVTKIDANDQQDAGTESSTLEIEERSPAFTLEAHAEHF